MFRGPRNGCAVPGDRLQSAAEGSGGICARSYGTDESNVVTRLALSGDVSCDELVADTN